MTCQSIQNLIDYALQKKRIAPEDVFVVRNQLMELMQVHVWEETKSTDETVCSIDEILEELVQDACERGIISDTIGSRDAFDTKLMGVLTPFPREVCHTFWEYYQQSPKAATDWYYAFSKDLNYVRAGRIAKDLKWQYVSSYGTLDITINRSKPEKDPRDIAAACTAKVASYPKCQLCPENAGFSGNAHHPARQNLRPIPVEIYGQKWQLQYSPYGYYPEHCILLREDHVPMIIDRAVFEKLLDAVTKFPHYFFGSNADLPIVGGSILSHEHFQGGCYTFAMEKAPILREFHLQSYPMVSCGIVEWPMSVIRVSSKDRAQLVEVCAEILKQWRSYSDEQSGIYAETNGIPHNTITPIARMRDDQYVCNLVLRNNRTSKERPLGIFHPAPPLHHIKKENIGLIEVMGLAVLPARLADELTRLEQAMCSGMKIADDPVLSPHMQWATEILAKYPNFSAENAKIILRQEVGIVFEQVLSCAGVFKRDSDGMAAFLRFVSCLKKI